MFDAKDYIIAYKYFSRNSEILSVSEAVVPLANIEYSYGFGVYESIRVSDSKLPFAQDHCKRLMESARIIGLEHNFTDESVLKACEELIKKNVAENCNLKILLIGGREPRDASLNILCLNPLYPDRKLYKQGAKLISQQFERPFPHAKSLNMLPSYLAYKKAKMAGAYDALAINQRGEIIEGTRTNFFGLKGKTIFSAPEDEILLGVTREHMLKVALSNGFKITEQSVKLSEINSLDGVFLTSTSSKIMPIRSIDDYVWGTIPDHLRELMAYFDHYLSERATP